MLFHFLLSYEFIAGLIYCLSQKIVKIIDLLWNSCTFVYKCVFHVHFIRTIHGTRKVHEFFCVLHLYGSCWHEIIRFVYVFQNWYTKPKQFGFRVQYTKTRTNCLPCLVTTGFTSIEFQKKNLYSNNMTEKMLVQNFLFKRVQF